MKSVIVLVLVLIACEKQAYAYADPGSGSLLWQILISGFVGGAFYLRKLTQMWKKRKDGE